MRFTSIMKFKVKIDFIKKEKKYFIDSEEVDIETYLSKLEKYKKEKYIGQTESLYEKDLSRNVDYHIYTTVV